MKKYKLLIFMSLVLMAPIIAAGKHSVQVSSSNPGPIKIAAFGDSIAHGTGDPLNKGFVVRFKEQFEEYKDVTILLSNFGIPKYKTEDVLRQLQDEAIKNEIKESNYLILNIGKNDFRNSAEYKFDQINPDNMNEGKKVFTQNLLQIILKIRKENANAPIFVMGLYNPYRESRNSLQLSKLIDNWNKEISLVLSGFDQCVFVPTLDLFIDKPKKRYFTDSIHPNAAGYQLISERLFEEIILFD